MKRDLSPPIFGIEDVGSEISAFAEVAKMKGYVFVICSLLNKLNAQTRNIYISAHRSIPASSPIRI